MKNIEKFTFCLLLVAGSVFLQNCGTSNAHEEDEKGEAAKEAEAPAPEAFRLHPGQLSSSMQIPGELVPFQQVDIYAKVSSFVRKLHVDVGSEVREGQLLASMEAPEINTQLITSQSKLRSQEAIYAASKANYERLLETSKTPGTVSQNDLDAALAKEKSDLAQLDAARSTSREVTDTRNYLEIRAPFSGIITSRNVSPGAYVGPTGKGSEFPLFTLVEQRRLRLVVSVPDAYVSYLKNKSEVSFRVKSLPDQEFKAQVARLAGALDTRLRSQRTEMDVVNNDKRLLPGMITEVSVPLNSDAKGFSVPKSSILNSTEGTFVIKVEGKKAIWVPVKTGHSGVEQTEIFGKIKENDVILKIANEEIRDQSEVASVKLTE